MPLSSLVSSPPGSTEDAMILDLMTKACIEESLLRLENQGVTLSVSHLAKYHDWLRAHRDTHHCGLVLKDVARAAKLTHYATIGGVFNRNG